MKRHVRSVLPALAYPLVPLVLLLTRTAVAQQYPLCPLTKQPPSLPTVPYRRCMDAAAASCCTDCKEIQNALAGVSANVSIIMPQLLTPLGPMNEVDYSGTTACDYLYGLDDCQFHLEQLLCALTCNPDSGNYVFVKAGRPILRVCPTYAQEVFQYCKDVSLGTVLVGAGFPTKELLLGRLFTPLVQKLGIGNVAFIVSEKNCYSGPAALPEQPACCDPLYVPKECPYGSVDTKKYAAFIGRSMDGGNASNACQWFPLPEDPNAAPLPENPPLPYITGAAHDPPPPDVGTPWSSEPVPKSNPSVMSYKGAGRVNIAGAAAFIATLTAAVSVFAG
ncbi:unnamed protein product [Closterium sp. NIES-64]|nr:unnamed protein product [Closterium sp. NIES-64]